MRRRLEILLAVAVLGIVAPVRAQTALDYAIKASEAAKLYEERPESVERRATLRLQLHSVPPPAPGRPTKRDRRELRRLKGDG